MNDKPTTSVMMNEIQIKLSDKPIDLTIEDLERLAKRFWVLKWEMVAYPPDEILMASGSSVGIHVKVTRMVNGYSAVVFCHGGYAVLIKNNIEDLMNSADKKLEEMV